MTPIVSVVIAAYNGQRYIAKTLESALAQTLQPIEVIVVDDGSTDATVEIVSRYPVRCVRQANGGTAAAHNRGVAEAIGQYVALLDHDDLWEPSKLEQQIDGFADPQVGLVHCAVRYFKSESGETTSEFFAGVDADLHAILGMHSLAPTSMVFSRAALQAVGGFDEAISGTDDWDLSLRVAERYRIVGVPTVLAHMRVHESNQGRNYMRMFNTAMAVLQKQQQRQPHGRCRACREAFREAQRVWRTSVYVGLAIDSRRLWREGRYLAAAARRLHGYALHPAALLNILHRAGGIG